MTGQTTIKVSIATRDRLKARAERFDYPSLEAYLVALIASAEANEAWEKLGESIAKMTDEDWASYHAETEIWDVTLMDGLEDEPPFPQD